ncbi:Kelch repeat-containing protein [Melittangium boletus]|uniref:Kelch repeat-containing protein n=1 Tax=Melittangium boletus TaxID=83453 RepID=UPI003DA5A8F0
MARGWVGRLLGVVVAWGCVAGVCPASARAPRGAPAVGLAVGPQVVLDDGRVLAAGGGGVFSPAHGTWRASGPGHTARTQAAAVRLGDGRVLVVGGATAAAEASTRAEVYVPRTRTWIRVEPMHEARVDAAAVVLADGRVLVVGGLDARRLPVRSAEVFEPTRGTWTRTGAPRATRRGAGTGVVLEDGDVLFVSGLQAERYSPASGTWREAGPVGGAAGTHRAGHSVTRLGDGRVLVVGGGMARAAATAEVYAPRTGTWRLVAPPGTPREAHATWVLPDGRVLVVGGAHAARGPLASVEAYDPETDTWREAPPLREARRDAWVLAREEGALWVGGGAAPGEAYVPGRWEAPPPVEVSWTSGARFWEVLVDALRR